jgi:glucoamylase
MACSTGFSRRSIGYVGFSDGWQDLMHNFKMDWEFQEAVNGNIAATGEVNLPDGGEFTIAVAFGRSYQSAATKLFQSMAEPFESNRRDFIRQWQRAVVNPEFDFSTDTSDSGGIYRLSRCVLLAHEDKVFQGAIVASMSIPWGETKGDNDLGGYHLVWTRDLVHSATALFATGQTSTPLRALIWLAAIQRPDGSFPQNSWIDGRAYWSGLQLDQVAFPILLAWRLHKQDALGLFSPRVMIARAAAQLILQGPVTSQDRWEENAGYSPSTLAVVIAALVCAAEWAKEYGKTGVADFIFASADWLAAHLEEWTVTTQGELAEGFPRHYIRINPSDPNAPDPHADPNTTMIQIANGGGLHPARNVVGGDFLHLVRFGIRDPNDPIIRDSIEVIDRVLKHELPQGPGWRRYNHDGYGQKDDGSAFDGTGVGRCWPILTGERGHYELAAGRDPKPFIAAIEDFSNQGGMLTEQVWDGPDLPDRHMKRGCPTGAAMPLCWSHAEYVALVRSRHDGVCFDRVESAFRRYVLNPSPSPYEIWSLRYPIQRVYRGKILRIILAAAATIVWSTNDWARTEHLDATHENELNLWYADFATAEWPQGSVLAFTFLWERNQRWEDRNWQVNIL